MVIQRFRPYFSGQAVQLEELSAALARRGVDVTIVTAVRGSDAPPDESTRGYRVRRLRSDLLGGPLARWGYGPTFAVRAGLDLRSRRGEIDLVHVHGVNDALYTSWALARSASLPIVLELTLTGADDPRAVRESKARFAARRLAVYGAMDGYVAISPQLESALRSGCEPRVPVTTISQGVDPERFAPPSSPAEGRVRAGVAEAPVCVLLGTLVERKGIDLLLAAWTTIADRVPAARLLLVGKDRFPEDPAAERFLEQALAAVPAAARERIVRTGVRENPEQLLGAADVFLFPSRREGFGTAIIEAMACGVPCVVADLPGITDFVFGSPIGPGGLSTEVPADGVVVPQEDAGALASAAVALLADPRRARTIGAAARARVLDRFAIEAVAAQYLAFYRRVREAYGGGAARS